MQIIVTDENRAQVQQWLAEAEAAYHKLMVGKATVSLSYDGESGSYTRASLAHLKKHISDLRAALGVSTRPARPRAMRPSYR